MNPGGIDQGGYMTQKGTNVDLAPVEGVSKEEAAGFKLDPHLLDLLWNEPFYSSILRKVTKIRTEDIPTAGVSTTGGELKLWWNPEFVAGLPTKQVRGLLKHECWHIILGHIFDRKQDPHTHWNYATDWAINSEVPEDELPECGLKPGVPFPELTDEQRMKMDSQRIADYETMSSFQAGLPKKKSSEWYFAELMKDSDVSDAIDRAGESGEPGFGQLDDHEGWEELSEEEREFVKGKVRKALEDAVKEADGKSNGWGSMPGETRKRIREIISSEIPWQSVLKKFCGLTRRANRSSNVRRLNRKYPGIHPGVQKGYTSSIAVYIDQSGSVSDGELELLFGELANLAKRTEFVLFNFDTEVDEASERLWSRSKTPSLERTRCGGTCFKAPTVHANKNSHRFDGYLVLTDGGASDPGPSKLKRGWVLTPGTDLWFGEAPKRDFLIKMKGKKAA
jgi:predicted metal-dependent peptidase